MDKWTADGLRISDKALLTELKKVIEDESALVIEHRYYRGSSAPKRFVCDDFEELEAYLNGPTVRPGDSFWIWKYEAVCRDDNAFVNGAKKPDEHGMTPVGGAY